MYFDLEDYHPDISPVGQAISWREGVLLSIIAHLVAVILILVMPKWFPWLTEPRRVQVAARQGQPCARWPEAPGWVRQVGQLPRGRLLAADSGRMCQPSAASFSASRAESPMVGMGYSAGVWQGVGDACRSPAVGPRPAPGRAAGAASPRSGLGA